MEKKPFKIEQKRNIFVVAQESGEYSDYCIAHDYLAANSQEEAWELFCRFYEKVTKDNKYGSKCLLWEKGGKSYVSESFKKDMYEGQEISWDTDYGDALLITIYPLPVIYFAEIRKLK